MDITKAKKVVELSKEGRKILVTLWEGDKISTCVTEEQTQTCQTCQCDDETCQEWINHLKEKGYEATEVELGELEVEESLPRFLEEREVTEVEPIVEATEESLPILEEREVVEEVEPIVEATEE